MTVLQLRTALRQFPDNAECRAYEGEVSGVIVDHKIVDGVISNDGSVKVHPKNKKRYDRWLVEGF